MGTNIDTSTFIARRIGTIVVVRNAESTTVRDEYDGVYENEKYASYLRGIIQCNPINQPHVWTNCYLDDRLYEIRHAARTSTIKYFV